MIVAGETVVHGYLRSPRIALDDERNRVDRTASVANPAPAENPAAADHHAVDGVADVGRFNGCSDTFGDDAATRAGRDHRNVAIWNDRCRLAIGSLALALPYCTLLRSQHRAQSADPDDPIYTAFRDC
jgi:hypothetical protein